MSVHEGLKARGQHQVSSSLSPHTQLILWCWGSKVRCSSLLDSGFCHLTYLLAPLSWSFFICVPLLSMFSSWGTQNILVGLCLFKMKVYRHKMLANLWIWIEKTWESSLTCPKSYSKQSLLMKNREHGANTHADVI